VVLENLIKGWAGELKTKLAQTLFLDAREYHVFNNVLLSANHGTTQIDHIVVSRYGVFVIETKNKDGWIYGKFDDDYWTQVFYRKKFKFQNPLHQNYLHEKTIAAHFKISKNVIFPVIVFWGKCQFKTDMPENILKNELTPYIKSKKSLLLNDQEVERICQGLRKIKDNTSSADNRNHIKRLKKRFHSS
jgi:hypothetical protein